MNLGCFEPKVLKAMKVLRHIYKLMLVHNLSSSSLDSDSILTFFKKSVWLVIIVKCYSLSTNHFVILSSWPQSQSSSTPWGNCPMTQCKQPFHPQSPPDKILCCHAQQELLEHHHWLVLRIRIILIIPIGHDTVKWPCFCLK